MSFSISTKITDNSMAVILDENVLDANNSASFLAEVLKVAKVSQLPLILDFCNIKHIDNTGLVKLMRLKSCMEICGKKISLTNIKTDVSGAGQLSWLINEVFSERTTASAV